MWCLDKLIAAHLHPLVQDHPVDKTIFSRAVAEWLRFQHTLAVELLDDRPSVCPVCITSGKIRVIQVDGNRKFVLLNEGGRKDNAPNAYLQGDERFFIPDAERNQHIGEVYGLSADAAPEMVRCCVCDDLVLNF